MNEKVEKTRGITLIALVVTIVVLIILAGITIGSLKGDDSIVKEAKTAKELAERESLEEQIEAAIIIAGEKHKEPTLDEVIEEIEKIGNVTVNRETGDITSASGYVITGKLDEFLEKTTSQES